MTGSREEHVRRSYEVDKNMQVIMRVPPFDRRPIERSRQAEALLRQQAEDARIPLLSSIHDAELANRQLDTGSPASATMPQLLRLAACVRTRRAGC